MTIGIGGWGSRRKPMAFVRALLRTDVKDLTIVTYGGPDLGLLCSAGKVRRVYYGFVSLDSAPFYDPWFAKARTSRRNRGPRDGRGHAALRIAGRRTAFAVPADPRRAGELGARLLGGRAGDGDSPYPARMADSRR